MIELFSVMNQLEKGALGLFFEMNYLVGVILSIYITWFIFTFEELRDKKSVTLSPKYHERNCDNWALIR